MDDSTTPLIIGLILCVFMSAFFSASETAFSAVNKIRLKNMANNGNKSAQRALDISNNYDTLLSTILIGNNIVNIASASIGTLIFTSYFGSAGVAISTVFVTVVILIVGEISPKSLAKESPEKFAMFATPILLVLMKLLTPFNMFFMGWKKMLSKVFKVKEDRGITEEELITLIDEVQSEGGINEAEGELIRSAVEFNDLEVSDLLTPRVNISAINIDNTNDEILETFMKTGYSRLPVYENNIDNIIGVLHEKKFHRFLYDTSEDKSLMDMIQPATWAPSSMKISQLMKILQTTKSHMAMIVDEYGGTKGIVTLEDIVEELVGEIWDEHDEIVEEVVELNPDDYLISGLAHIDTISDLFDVKIETSSSTVGGFASDQLGKMPEESDSFILDGLQYTIDSIEFRRVIRVRVTKLEDEETPE